MQDAANVTPTPPGATSGFSGQVPAVVCYLGEIGPAVDTARRLVGAHAVMAGVLLLAGLLVVVVELVVLKNGRPEAYWRLLDWRLAARAIRKGWLELAERCNLSARSRKAGGPLAAWCTSEPGVTHLRVPRIARIRRRAGHHGRDAHRPHPG